VAASVSAAMWQLVCAEQFQPRLVSQAAAEIMVGAVEVQRFAGQIFGEDMHQLRQLANKAKHGKRRGGAGGKAAALAVPSHGAEADTGGGSQSSDVQAGRHVAVQTEAFLPEPVGGGSVVCDQCQVWREQVAFLEDKLELLYLELYAPCTDRALTSDGVTSAAVPSGSSSQVRAGSGNRKNKKQEKSKHLRRAEVAADVALDAGGFAELEQLPVAVRAQLHPHLTGAPQDVAKLNQLCELQAKLEVALESRDQEVTSGGIA